ncbi:hypothetical protein V8E36_006781 [Tilletia maclaganii]
MGDLVSKDGQSPAGARCSLRRPPCPSCSCLWSVSSSQLCAPLASKPCDCQQFAEDNCDNYQAPQNANAFSILRYQCLRLYWEGLTSNIKCPHPAVGCPCYNGCVQDRHDSERDVGGWCTVACKTCAQNAPDCT